MFLLPKAWRNLLVWRINRNKHAVFCSLIQRKLTAARLTRMLLIALAARRSIWRSGMKLGSLICLLAFAFAIAASPSQSQKGGEVQAWLTNADKSSLFELQKPSLRFSKPTGEEPAIEIDDQKPFQTIDGFGFALTGGSA